MDDYNFPQVWSHCAYLNIKWYMAVKRSFPKDTRPLAIYAHKYEYAFAGEVHNVKLFLPDHSIITLDTLLDLKKPVKTL